MRRGPYDFNGIEASGKLKLMPLSERIRRGLELGEKLGRWRSIKAILDGADWARAMAAEPEKVEALDREWRQKCRDAMEYEARHGDGCLYQPEHPINKSLENHFARHDRLDPR